MKGIRRQLLRIRGSEHRIRGLDAAAIRDKTAMCWKERDRLAQLGGESSDDVKL